jgi:ketosteroid isomerase-like protein
MNRESDVLAADRQFFASLIGADVQELNALLADDFVMVDVMRGAEISKAELVAAIEAGLVRFEAIEATENRVRLYGDAAVVNGRTEMRMRFGGNTVTVRSRYTHVFTRLENTWQFVSAQGTPIAPD